MRRSRRKEVFGGVCRFGHIALERLRRLRPGLCRCRRRRRQRLRSSRQIARWPLCRCDRLRNARPCCHGELRGGQVPNRRLRRGLCRLRRQPQNGLRNERFEQLLSLWRARNVHRRHRKRQLQGQGVQFGRRMPRWRLQTRPRNRRLLGRHARRLSRFAQIQQPRRMQRRLDRERHSPQRRAELQPQIGQHWRKPSWRGLQRRRFVRHRLARLPRARRRRHAIRIRMQRHLRRHATKRALSLHHANIVDG